MRLKDSLHIFCIIFLPGYWILALIIFIHHKIKHIPLNLIEEEKKIKNKIHNKIEEIKN